MGILLDPIDETETEDIQPQQTFTSRPSVGTHIDLGRAGPGKVMKPGSFSNMETQTGSDDVFS